MKSISIGTEFCSCSLICTSILASVEDGLRGIIPSEADLIRGKVVSTIRNNKRSRSVLTKKEHKALQRLKKDASILITKVDKGNIIIVLDQLWPTRGPHAVQSKVLCSPV